MTSSPTHPKFRFSLPFRLIAQVLIVCLVGTGIPAPREAHGRTAPEIPRLGELVPASPDYAPPTLAGLKIYPDNPFRFDFLIDPGDSRLTQEAQRDEFTRLIKYFLAALTIPEGDLWVNLSPFEKDRIMTDAFGRTQMGRDMLVQDYMLKQMSASVIYPESEVGENYWREVFARFNQEFGSSEVPVEMVNKVWVVPRDAELYVEDGRVLITESRLEVMLGEDYQARLREDAVTGESVEAEVSGETAARQELWRQLFREHILPEVARDVNHGRNFNELRQIYHAVILATWYRRHLRQSLFGQMYVGREKTDGVDIADRTAKEKIYEQYLKAIKRGVYDYIKEDFDPVTQGIIARRYFSGGIMFSNLDRREGVYRETRDPGVLSKLKITARQHLERLYYLVSSVVISKEGVASYQKLELAARPRTAARIRSAIPVERLSRLFRRTFAAARSKVRGVGLLAGAAFLATTLGMGQPVQAAEYTYDDQGRFVVVVEQGDDFGEIVEDLRVAHKRYDNARYTPPLRGQFWGPDGAVYAMARLMERDNLGLHPGDVLVIPGDVISEATQTALAGPVPYTPPMLTGPLVVEEPELDLTPLEPVKPAPQLQEFTPPDFVDTPAIVTDTDTDEGAADRIVEAGKGERLDAGDNREETQITAVPETSPGLFNRWTLLGVLGLIGAGVIGVLLYRSRGGRVLSAEEEQDEPADLPQEDPGRLAQRRIIQEALRIRLQKLSLNYSGHTAKLRQAAVDVTRPLADYLADRLNSVLPDGRGDITGLVQEYVTAPLRDGIAGAIDTAGDFESIERNLDAWTDGLAGTILEQDLPVAEVERRINAYIQEELDPLFAAAESAAVSRVSAELFSAEWMNVYQARIESLLRRRLADQDGLNDLPGFLSETATALTQLFREEGLITGADSLTLSAGLSAAQVAAVIRRHSPEYRGMLNRAYAHSEAIREDIITALLDGNILPEGISKEEARAYLRDAAGAELDRIVESEFDRRAGYLQVEARVDAFAAAVAETLAGEEPDLSAQQRLLRGFIDFELRDTVTAAVAAAEEALRAQLFGADMPLVYRAAMEKAVRTEVAVANGAPVNPALMFAQAVENVLTALKDDMKLIGQAIIPPPEELLAAVGALFPEPVTAGVPDDRRLRAPPFEITRADIAAAAAAVTIYLGGDGSAAEGLLLAASPLLFRAGVTASYWLHELTHVAAAGPSAVTSANLRANVPFGDWLRMLVPVFGTVPGDLHVKAPNTWWNHLSAVGTSLALTLGLAMTGLSAAGAHAIEQLQLITPLLLGSAFVLAGAIQTDVIDPLLKRIKQGANCCGVAILLGKRKEKDEPVIARRLLGVYKRMGEITNIRGQQAAGAVISARNAKGMSTFVGDRRVNPKHGDLPEGLEGQIRRHVRAARVKGFGDTGTTMMFGHYRYGTTSAPAKKETHPHRFVEPRDVRYWEVSDGRLEAQTRELEIYIVHNGDFNYWTMYGTKHGNSHIGFWLEHVLGVVDETQGDSPKISGMMNLLRTQGIFGASARLAYYTQIATRIEDVFGGQHPADILPDFSKSLVQPSEDYIFKKTMEAKRNAPNTALTQDEIAELGKVFDDLFTESGESLLTSGAARLADMWVSREQAAGGDEVLTAQRARIDAFAARAAERLAGVPLTAAWSIEQRDRFIEATLEAFFMNDEFTAVRRFLEGAQGSFGMGLATSLNPGGVVVAADGQPLAVGMDTARENILIASEFSALKVPVDEDGTRLDYRFALKQEPGKGEIVAIAPDGRLQVYSRERRSMINEGEITRRLVPLKNNPYITELAVLDQEDPVGKDIAETAAVLGHIRDEWTDPDSMNRQSLAGLQEQIIRKHILRRIKKTSAAYAGIHNALSRKARAAVRDRLNGYLRAELGERIPLDEELWKKLGMDRFTGEVQHLVEIALDQAFAWHEINEHIGAKAAVFARRHSVGVLSLDQLQDEIHLYVDHLLKDTIEAELQRAQSMVDEIIAHWQPVIAAEIVFEWTRAKAQQRTGDLSPIGRQAIAQWKGIWRKLNIRLTMPPETPKTDVLVTGLETSLWMGEQFAQDLQRMFPEMVVRSESANKLLEDPLSTGLDEDTIVIAVSQSGQTFPSLNATILLDKITRHKVFVVTGEYDTLMGQAVGQDFQPDARFSGRIFSNFTGFRHAEASSVTATATHATFTEMLIYLAEGLHDRFPYDSPYGLAIEEGDVADVKAARDRALEETARITGKDADGKTLESPERSQILQQARNWARNVLDAPLAVILSKINLYVTVVSGFFVFLSIAKSLPLVGGLAGTVFIASFLQAMYYDYFSAGMNYLLRKITGREMLDRIGKRTVVIGDKAYVHQSLEAFLSKLNSLSRGIVGVEVHGANPGDHMISRFGHRVVRGTMIWIGVPDGRMPGLRQKQASVEMTAKQGKGVRNRIFGRGIGPNVVTVGRRRVHNPNVADSTIILNGEVKTDKPALETFVENRFDSMTRLVAGQVFFHAMQRRVATAGLSKPWRWLWYWRWNIHRTQSGPRIATTQSPVDAEILEQLEDRPIYPAAGVREVIRRPDGGHRYDRDTNPVDGGDAALLAEPATVTGGDEVGGIDLRGGTVELNITEGLPTVPADTLPAGFTIDPLIIETLPVNGFTPLIIDVRPINAIYFLGEGDSDRDQPRPRSRLGGPVAGYMAEEAGITAKSG